MRLSVPRIQVAAPTDGSAPKRPPFVVSLPTSAFSIAAFAEAWEYEDDEEMYGVDDEDLEGLGIGRDTREQDRKNKNKNKAVGVLERRANVTIVGGEVAIGKEAVGNIKVVIYFILLKLCCTDTAFAVQHVGLIYISLR